MKLGGITHPVFRPCYKATVIETVCYWLQNQKYRSMEQNRKPRDKLTHLWALIFGKKVKNTVEKRQPLQKTILGKLDSYM